MRRFVLALLTLLTVAPLASASATTTAPVAKVYVEPAAGYGWVSSVLATATTSIDLCIYELEDPTIEHALVARAQHGVTVRVIVNADYTGRKANAGAAAAFAGTKVTVVWAPAGQIFHAKYFVLDHRVAFIGTGNFTPQYYASSRDFWSEETTPATVAALEGTFSADVAGRHNLISNAAGVVWSPGSGPVLEALIASARHSLWVENEEMKFVGVENALAAAARRGVAVHVVMTASSSWAAALQQLADAGVHVVTHAGAQLYVHAKVICVDCVGSSGTVFFGSENFSTSSLAYNRELGVVTTSPAAVGPLLAALESDATVGTALGSGSLTTSTTSGGSTSGAVSVVSIPSTVARGTSPTVTVKTLAGASCSLTVTLPSGHVSTAAGLGSATAAASGLVSWTWHVASNTTPGTAEASVRCPNGTLSKSFAITG